MGRRETLEYVSMDTYRLDACPSFTQRPETILWMAVLGILLFAGLSSASGESPAWGSSQVVHFGAEDYEGGHQTWVSGLDSNGFLYFLSNQHLFQYDGAYWRKAPFAGAMRMLVDGTDRVHVAGHRDFGYFEVEPDGELAFTSLRARLAPEQQDFGDSHEILAVGHDVVYCTSRYLYVLRPDGEVEVAMHSDTASFRGVFAWQDELYVWVNDRGLLYVPRGDGRRTFQDAEPLGGGEALAGLRIEALVPWTDGAALVFTHRSGTFLLRHQALEPINLPADDFFRTQRPLHAQRRSDGRLVVTTLRGGAAILDDQGRILEIFDSQRPEPINDTIYHSFEDQYGNLWFSTDFGIFRIPRSSARRVVEPTEVGGTPHRTLRHGEFLYLATRSSLLRKRLDAPQTDSTWNTVLDTGTWFLLTEGDDLLAATNDGVYRVAEATSEVICPAQAVAIYRSLHFPHRLLAANRRGLRFLERQGETWQCGELLDGIDEYIYELQDGDGSELIMRSWKDELYVLDAAQTAEGAPSVHRFQLPEGTSELLHFDGDLWLSNDRSGLLRYRGLNPSGDFPFVQDGTLLQQLGFEDDAEGVLLVDYDAETERLWLVNGSSLEVARRSEDGTFERRAVAADQIAFWCDIYRDPLTDRYWLTNHDGVFQWDPGAGRSRVPPSTYLRRVLRLPSRETLPWGEASTLDYQDNSLRFEFAAPIFDQLTPVEYQHRLEGFDEGWSARTSEPAKEYTNLREGSYRFRVRAVDRWGAMSEVASHTFTIRPPFHRSTVAYALYALGLCAVVLLALRGHRRTVARERAVSDRLREVDRLKDTFLANTSHELRTPLHGISGLAESLMDGAVGETSETVQENLSVIVASSRRLGHLVDDILDFSKLRHQHLVLDHKAVHLRSLAELVLTLSRPLVGTRSLELRNEVPRMLPAAQADENRLQQILFNLVGNAVKFTDSGTVTVLAEARGDRLRVSVRDTGIGIPKDQQQRIFNAFEQLDATHERRYAGTGLGLAVTSQLVELHGGRLQVESEPGEGSTFSFDLGLAGAMPGEADDAADPVGLFAEDSVTIQAPFQTQKMTFPDGEPTARLLVVDDEPVNQRVLSNFLAGERFALTLASSGSEALERMDDQRFDLVLLDVMMPGMSGYEVCRRIRENHPVEKLPVLILSALKRPEERILGLAQGANDFLTKPVLKGELISRVRMHLALLEAHRRSEDEVVSLQGLLPMCMTCKSIRDDEGYWSQLEEYISRRSEAQFTHGICPPCAEEMLGSLDD